LPFALKQQPATLTRFVAFDWWKIFKFLQDALPFAAPAWCHCDRFPKADGQDMEGGKQQGCCMENKLK